MQTEIVKILGGRQTFNATARNVDLLDEAEKSLPVNAYEAVAAALHLTLEEEDWLLPVSMLTRASWKKRSRLDPATSDRLTRIARILALATFVLKDRQHAVKWLRKPSEILKGRAPLAAIATDVGAEKVSNLLYQMEHGVYA